jgi:hypothetical protein
VPTTETAPVAENKLPAVQAPAVPLNVAPTPRPKETFIPVPFVAPTHVPVVSPGIVIVSYSQVFA